MHVLPSGPQEKRDVYQMASVRVELAIALRDFSIAV